MSGWDKYDFAMDKFHLWMLEEFCDILLEEHIDEIALKAVKIFREECELQNKETIEPKR